MSTSVNVAHAQAWHRAYYHLAQQKESRFQRFTRRDGEVRGKWAWFNRLGAVEMQERTSRHQDTIIVDDEHTRRGCSLKDYELGHLIDPQDLHRLVSDPQNAYVRNGVYARNRKKDNVILRAVNGTAVSADEDDSQTSNSLPSAQKVAVGSTGLTVAKLRDARRILRAAEAVSPEDEEELPFAVSAQQMDDLLGITNVTSMDFNEGKPLVTGRIARFMGFVFIETEDLQTDGSGDRLCLAWKPSAIGYREPDGEMETDIGPRRDKGRTIQLLHNLTAGAVRIEDVGVVEVACSES